MSSVRWRVAIAMLVGGGVVALGAAFPAGAATISARPIGANPFEPVAPVATTAASPPVAAAGTAHVAIVDFGFSPSSITVTAGTRVIWTNTGGSIHSVTSDTGVFDSSPSCPGGACLDPGGTFSHTFAQAGRFSYHCRVHSNMTATVIVTAAASPTTTTTTPSTAPTTAGPSVSAGGAATPTTAAPAATGPQLAFTGTPARTAGLALAGVLTIALGLALRPRRRPFPIDPSDSTDPT